MGIQCDTEGAIKLAKHQIASQRSKHIDVIYPDAREFVERGEMPFMYSAPEKMGADFLTKGFYLPVSHEVRASFSRNVCQFLMKCVPVAKPKICS
jgi:hypothetical protein